MLESAFRPVCLLHQGLNAEAESYELSSEDSARPQSEAVAQRFEHYELGDGGRSSAISGLARGGDVSASARSLAAGTTQGCPTARRRFARQPVRERPHPVDRALLGDPRSVGAQRLRLRVLDATAP
jgi:hypothetical protein